MLFAHSVVDTLENRIQEVAFIFTVFYGIVTIVVSYIVINTIRAIKEFKDI